MPSVNFFNPYLGVPLINFRNNLPLALKSNKKFALCKSNKSSLIVYRVVKKCKMIKKSWAHMTNTYSNCAYLIRLRICEKNPLQTGVVSAQQLRWLRPHVFFRVFPWAVFFKCPIKFPVFGEVDKNPHNNCFSILMMIVYRFSYTENIHNYERKT